MTTTDPIADLIIERTEIADTVKVEIPVSLLRRMEVAMCEYSDYGSNDAEHAALVELAELAGYSLSSAGDEGFATWSVTVRLPDATPGEVEQLATNLSEIPSSLQDTLHFDVAARTITVTVPDQRLGVAQAAAGELMRELAAATRVELVDFLSDPDA